MQFTVLPVRGWPVSPMPGQAFLVRDNWDDYSFKTTFQLLCVDPDGEIRDIGAVKIGRFGMAAPARTPLPEGFEGLDGAFFSLGLKDTYYDRLRELGPELQRTVLQALNDVSFEAAGEVCPRVERDRWPVSSSGHPPVPLGTLGGLVLLTKIGSGSGSVEWSRRVSEPLPNRMRPELG